MKEAKQMRILYFQGPSFFKEKNVCLQVEQTLHFPVI